MHEQETVEIIYGVNPVKEALRAGMPIERAYTCRAQGAVLPLIGQLKSLNVPILEVDEKRMSYLCPKEEGRTPNHQGDVYKRQCYGVCRIVRVKDGKSARDFIAVAELEWNHDW